MPSAFVRQAVADLIARAEGLGVPVPDEVRRLTFCGSTNAGARLYALAHPKGVDDPTVPEELGWCCEGAAMRDLSACTCWQPMWNLEQQLPALPVVREQLMPRDRGCSDCAFRKDSPERPLAWRHPHGITIDGDPADWQPPIVNAIPFRADGSPALLCAGWAARAARAKAACRG